MSFNKNLIVLLYILSILMVLVTVLPGFSFTVNDFQRLTGLISLTLIFWQLMLGSFMGKSIDMFGAKVFNLHVTQGIIIYVLVLLHPLLFSLFNLQVMGKFDFFLVPSGFYPRIYELGLTFGRVALILLTVTVITAYFRAKPFFRKNWDKLHLFNYLVFFFVWTHAFMMGSDTMGLPFSPVMYSFLGVILAVSVRRLLQLIPKRVETVNKDA